MGIAELNAFHKEISIHSCIITYGNAATAAITEQVRQEIEDWWNEPKGTVVLKNNLVTVRFRITANWQNDLQPEHVFENLDPKNNYFRIEEFAHGNISFVDGLGCNSGYFKLENLYKGSTTAAHEYGHTLGLEHPKDIDLRGKGAPGIMYPRGTLVDPPFQYDPGKPAGTKGGTMHPIHRRVKQDDIDLLRLHRLNFENKNAVIGEFTSIWHDEHQP